MNWLKEYVHNRKRRYMAQLLGAFETEIEPLLTNPHHEKVTNFKALMRMRVNALAVDVCDAVDGRVQNGHAEDLRDRLSLSRS